MFVVVAIVVAVFHSCVWISSWMLSYHRLKAKDTIKITSQNIDIVVSMSNLIKQHNKCVLRLWLVKWQMSMQVEIYTVTYLTTNIIFWHFTHINKKRIVKICYVHFQPSYLCHLNYSFGSIKRQFENQKGMANKQPVDRRQIRIIFLSTSKLKFRDLTIIHVCKQ